MGSLRSLSCSQAGELCRPPGIRRHDAIAIAVLPAQVALYGAQHLRVIINGHQYRFGHNKTSASR